MNKELFKKLINKDISAISELKSLINSKLNIKYEYNLKESKKEIFEIDVDNAGTLSSDQAEYRSNMLKYDKDEILKRMKSKEFNEMFPNKEYDCEIEENCIKIKKK